MILNFCFFKVFSLQRSRKRLNSLSKKNILTKSNTKEHAGELLPLLIKALEASLSAFYFLGTQFSSILNYLCTIFCDQKLLQFNVFKWRNNSIVRCVFIKKKSFLLHWLRLRSKVKNSAQSLKLHIWWGARLRANFRNTNIEINYGDFGWLCWTQLMIFKSCNQQKCWTHFRNS